MNKTIILLTFWVFSLSGFTSTSESLKTFVHQESQVQLALEIIEKLENNHLVKKDYISIRDEAFEEYIDRLDPNKTVFSLAEVPKLEKDTSSNNLMNEDLGRAFDTFNNYVSRYYERHNLQINYLESLKEEDLNGFKQIKRDLADNERARSLEELRTLWKNLVLNDVIQLILTGNDLQESITKTKKRLDNQLNYFEQTRSEDVFNIYVNSITSIYGPHTSYMSPKNTEDFDINMSLSLEGIGALLSSDGLYTSISSLVPGGPAEKSELLKPEDKIIGVGQDEDGEIVDVIGWRIDDVVDLIRGPKGSKVRLQIIPSSALSDSETSEISIIRNIVKLEDQAAEKKILDFKRGQQDYKVGVIELPAFYFDFEGFQNRDINYKSASKDVKVLLKELKRENVDGLVIDLRNNGGGSLYEANELAQLFLGRGTTVQVKSSNGNIQGLGQRWGYQFYDKPVVVLVNKFSASASEILAGAIQDYGRGLVVGTSTFGKGTVQKVDLLSSGQIKFTESKFYRVSGSSTQNLGVEPDINLPTPFDIEELGESSLDRALDHDSIPSTSYKNFNRVSQHKDSLRKRSLDRIKESTLFESIRSRKEWQNENQTEFLDLNLDKRLKQKSEIENFLLANENNLRSKLNLPTFESYKDFLDREDDPELLDMDNEILVEAANILIDYIELKDKQLIAINQRSSAS